MPKEEWLAAIKRDDQLAAAAAATTTPDLSGSDKIAPSNRYDRRQWL